MLVFAVGGSVATVALRFRWAATRQYALLLAKVSETTVIFHLYMQATLQVRARTMGGLVRCYDMILRQNAALALNGKHTPQSQH